MGPRVVSAWRTGHVVGSTTTALPTTTTNAAHHATLLHENQPPTSAFAGHRWPGMQLLSNRLSGIAPGQARVLGRLTHHLFHTFMLIGTVALGKGFMLAYLLTPLVTIIRHRELRYEGKRNAFYAMTGICLVFGLG